MPRLSVDIDLTYVPVADRAPSLKEIDAAMRRIAKEIERGVPGAKVSASAPKGEKGITKLTVRADEAQIKIEVTPVLRGCVYKPAVRSLCFNRSDKTLGRAIQAGSGPAPKNGC